MLDLGYKGQWFKTLEAPGCVLEQDMLSSHSSASYWFVPSEEHRKSSRHGLKIVDWDVKHKHKQNMLFQNEL